jgi:hypothetical protein
MFIHSRNDAEKKARIAKAKRTRDIQDLQYVVDLYKKEGAVTAMEKRTVLARVVKGKSKKLKLG